MTTSLARMRAFGTGLALAGAALLLTSPAAPAAATKTKTVKAEVVFATGQRPGKPGNCSAVVFVKWTHDAAATSTKVIYTYKGAEQSKMVEAPYDDTYEWVATYQVPAGFHWIAMPPSWRSGPTPSDCADLSIKQREAYSTEARVEMTIPDPACTAAQTKLETLRAKVTKLQSRLRKASTDAGKQRLRRQITTAKAERSKASKRVGKVC